MVGVEVPPVSADVSVGVGGMVLFKHNNILLIYLLNIHTNLISMCHFNMVSQLLIAYLAYEQFQLYILYPEPIVWYFHMESQSSNLIC